MKSSLTASGDAKHWKSVDGLSRSGWRNFPAVEESEVSGADAGS